MTASPKSPSPSPALGGMVRASLASEIVERETGIPSDYEKLLVSRKSGNDFFDHSICKVFLLRITAHVLERKNSDRWLVRSPDQQPASNQNRSCRSLSGPSHAIASQKCDQRPPEALFSRRKGSLQND